MLEECWDEIHHLSIHRYSPASNGETPHSLAEGIEIDRMIQQYAALIDSVRSSKKSNRRIYLALDEWGVWHRDGATDGGWKTGAPILEGVYTLQDALVYAQYLNSFVRHADIVKIACLAQIVNVLAPVVTGKDGLLLQATYYPFQIMSAHARGLSLTPKVEGPALPASGQGNIPALDVSASADIPSGEAAIFFINRSEQRLEVTVTLAGLVIESILGADLLSGPETKTANTWEHPSAVIPKPGRVTKSGPGLAIELPGISFACVRIGLVRK